MSRGKRKGEWVRRTPEYHGRRNSALQEKEKVSDTIWSIRRYRGVGDSGLLLLARLLTRPINGANFGLNSDSAIVEVIPSGYSRVPRYKSGFAMGGFETFDNPNVDESTRQRGSSMGWDALVAAHPIDDDQLPWWSSNCKMQEVT